MKTKSKYISPKIEIIEVETEGVIAQSDPYISDEEVIHTSGRAKKRNFWED